MITGFYEERLRPSGLTAAQFELLGQLSGRTEAAQGVLANALGVDQTTLSRNLKLLGGRGWVARSVSNRDGRSSCFRLTADGETVLRQALPLWQEAQREMEERLGTGWTAAWSILHRLERLSGTASH